MLKRLSGGSNPGMAHEEPPSLIIARRERLIGDDGWFEAKSWIGGVPKLGGQSWPRANNNKPLHFLAQLDLSEIEAAGRGRTALPTEGAFAFFVGFVADDRLSGRILHVKSPDTSATTVPLDLGSVEDIGCDPFVDTENLYGPRHFPFWPVEFRQLPAIPRASVDDEEAMERVLRLQTEAINQLYQRRTYSFKASYESEKSALGEAPLFWLAALMFAERVPRMRAKVAAQRTRGEGYVKTSRARLDALEKGLPPPVGQGPFGDLAKERANSENWMATGRKSIAEADAHAAAVDAYVAKVAEIVKPTDPWELISSEDIAGLGGLFGEAHSREFKSFSRYILPTDWREYATDAIKLMAAGPKEAYARLPAGWRDLINTRYRLPIDYPHLMFGVGANIQGNEMFEHPEMRMVLQIGFDDMMYWPFGDNGAYHFWMPVDALRTGDVSKARITFESH